MRNPVASMLLRVHLVASVLVALPLLWLSITGALLAFADNIDRIIEVDLMTIAPSTEPLQKDVMDDFIQAAKKQYSGYNLVMIAYPNAPSESLRTLWKDEQGTQRELFFNPYTGALLGERLSEHTFAAHVRRLHTLGYDFFTPAQSAILGIIIVIALVALVSGMWRFAEMQLLSSAVVGSQHALIGLVLLLPIAIMLISALALLYTQHTSALLWHTGSLLGFGGRVLWFFVAACFAWLISVSCYRLFRSR